MHHGTLRIRTLGTALLAAGWLLGAAACSDDDNSSNSGVGPNPGSPELPDVDSLTKLLKAAQAELNGGLHFQMWATVVDRSGIVRAVAFSGPGEGDQWLGSRVISAQKANTANDFSLDGFALSSANLYAATQPGGSLFGLQESNPVNTDAAYGGDATKYGTVDDFMIGKRIGGINVFGGGVALYDASGKIIGGLGVSGDTSCADHNIAWKVRDALALDFVPAGVADGGADDNIIYDIPPGGTSTSGFGHPTCLDLAGNGNSQAIGTALPTSNPISTVPTT
jgi:uncharacterized protein GlcG (DUF336 family)